MDGLFDSLFCHAFYFYDTLIGYNEKTFVQNIRNRFHREFFLMRDRIRIISFCTVSHTLIYNVRELLFVSEKFYSPSYLLYLTGFLFVELNGNELEIPECNYS